jgi:hypothetical protein
MMSVIVVKFYAECHYAECRHAECRGNLFGGEIQMSYGHSYSGDAFTR